jgi:hypothetical protein
MEQDRPKPLTVRQQGMIAAAMSAALLAVYTLMGVL